VSDMEWINYDLEVKTTIIDNMINMITHRNGA
jgi:hypothetical protein